MARTLVGVASLLLLAGAGALWYVVSSDRWPWDDRKPPATLVWGFNEKVGKFLYEHGQDTPEEIAAAQPRREALTAQEKAEVDQQLKARPSQERLALHPGGGFVGGASGFQLKPATLGLNLSVGGCGGGGGGGGTGGRGGTGGGCAPRG